MKAELYRMVMKDHVCPFGIKSKYLLEKAGFEVEDHHLTSREETDEFKKSQAVKTTPQTFIGDRRIGGYDDVRSYLDKPRPLGTGETSYLPVIALFGMAFLMALGIASSEGEFSAERVLMRFGALAMCLLSIQKLRDPFSFSNGFLNYDLLSLRYVPYSYIYPLLEALAGVLMLMEVLPALSGVIAILIGLEGAISVYRAVYVKHRELHCACMGGDSNVPLGFVSLTENVLMVVMGIWMLVIA